MYLTAEGNPGYLKELRELEVGRDTRGRLPVPQQIRALLQFNLTLLTPEARLTLERTTIHPGPISERLLLRFNGASALEELARHGWLVFNSQRSLWTVRSELVRQVVYQTLHAGRRRSYHQQAAEFFRGSGDGMSAIYHDYMTCGSSGEFQALAQDMQAGAQPGPDFGYTWAKLAFEEWTERRLTNTDSAQIEPSPGLIAPRKSVQAGPELTILPMVGGAKVEQDVSRLTLKRTPLDLEDTQISWELPDEPTLVRLKGRGYCANPLGAGISGMAAPLEVRFSRLTSRIVLAPVRQPDIGPRGEIVLPLTPRFDFWCLLPAGGYLTAASAAEVGLIELEVLAYRVAAMGEGIAGSSVEAFDLVAIEDQGVRAPVLSRER